MHNVMQFPCMCIIRKVKCLHVPFLSTNHMHVYLMHHSNNYVVEDLFLVHADWEPLTLTFICTLVFNIAFRVLYRGGGALGIPRPPQQVSPTLPGF